MDRQNERAAKKDAELQELAVEAITRHWRSKGLSASSEDANAAAADLLCHYVRNTAPEESISIGLMTMQMGGRGGGVSRKPGNLLLNLRSLVAALAKSGMALASVYRTPETAVLAALVIWNEVWAGMTAQVAEREAIVLWTMWTHRDAHDCVSHGRLRGLVNDELASYGRSPMTSVELAGALRALHRLRAIERSKGDRGNWWLREYVNVRYA